LLFLFSLHRRKTPKKLGNFSFKAAMMTIGVGGDFMVLAQFGKVTVFDATSWSVAPGEEEAFEDVIPANAIPHNLHGAPVEMHPKAPLRALEGGKSLDGDTSIKARRRIPDSTTGHKTQLFDVVQDTITVDDAIKEFTHLYPGKDYQIEGDLVRGLVIYATDPESCALVAVRSNQFLVAAVEFAGNGRQEIEIKKGGDPVTLADIALVASSMLGLGEDEKLEVYGNLNSGLNFFRPGVNMPALVCMTQNKDNTAIAAVLLKPEAENIRVLKARYGAPQGAGHIESSRLADHSPEAEADVKALVEGLWSGKTMIELEKDGITKGWGRVGLERECWMYDRQTGQLKRMSSIELHLGCVEIDDGHYIDLDEMLVGLARKRLELEKLYPGLAIVTSSTSMSDDPRQTRINIINPTLGRYVMSVENLLWQRFQTGPKTPESWYVKNQIAAALGMAGALEMIKTIGDTRLWNNAASHLNFGELHTQEEGREGYGLWFESIRNGSNALMCELGAAIEMICASGPYTNGIAPVINGEMPLDERKIGKRDMGSAEPHNVPILDATHYKHTVKTTMTQGDKGADRLARAVVAHVPDELVADIMTCLEKNDHEGFVAALTEIIATAHGKGRWRFEPSSRMDGRLEYTGAGASSALPRVRAVAMGRMLSAISKIATHEKKDFLQMVAEDLEIPVSEVWGNDDATVLEYVLKHDDSPRTRTLLKRLRKLFVKYDMPALHKDRTTSLAALDALLFDGDFDDFANGKGTYATAMRHLARRGYSAHQAVLVADAFEHQEAEFLNSATLDQLESYREGRGGFNFVWPEVGEPKNSSRQG
jgi:hypothetical protein